MKKLILLLLLFLNVTAFAQTPEIEGEWTPDTDCWLGDIRIKHIEGNKYKVRLQTRDGFRTMNATFSDGELAGRFEIGDPEYGEFWVVRHVSRGHENEYEIRESNGGSSYNICGLASGHLNGNWDYKQTNSRSNCATVHESYCCVDLYFSGGEMTAYFSFRGVYLKNGYSMFYQDSGKGKGFRYTQW